MRRKAFLIPIRQRRHQRWTAGLLLLAVLVAGLSLMGIFPTGPAHADSGGFPTKTYTVTPSPTETATATATATSTPTQQAAVIAETPVPPAATNTSAGEEAATPPPAGNRPNLVCWPFALIVVLIGVLVGSMLFGNRP